MSYRDAMARGGEASGAIARAHPLRVVVDYGPPDPRYASLRVERLECGHDGDSIPAQYVGDDGTLSDAGQLAMRVGIIRPRRRCRVCTR